MQQAVNMINKPDVMRNMFHALKSFWILQKSKKISISGWPLKYLPKTWNLMKSFGGLLHKVHM